MVGENYRIRDVAEIVQDVVPDCEIAFAPGASPDTRNYRVDFRKIAERAARRSSRRGRCARASRSCTTRTRQPV